jgi:tRNA(Ile)-lysidine synthase
MGPHPAVADVRRAVRSALTELDGPVLVACSGGADSLALAAAVAFEAPRAGVPAGLVTVDHGLQDGSAAQAARVAGVGRELGLDPVHVRRVEVGAGGGPEAAARTVRYAALAGFGRPVLLGHTLDDQAETVLLGLGRGSGARSLAGMRLVDGPWIRPLLGLRRTTTRAACAALGLDPWDDPHNADPSFRRVRVRREVLPLLEDVLAGGVAEALARTADQLQADADALDAWAEQVFLRAVRVSVPEPGTSEENLITVTELEELPGAVRTRVLRRWAHAGGAEPLSAERTSAVDALITRWHGQGPVDLPGGVSVRRASDTLELRTTQR